MVGVWGLFFLVGDLREFTVWGVGFWVQEVSVLRFVV